MVEEMVSQDPTRDLIRSEAARLGPNGSPNLTFGLGASEAFRSGPGGSVPKICTPEDPSETFAPQDIGANQAPSIGKEKWGRFQTAPQNGLDGILAAQIGLSRIESWGPTASAT